jgi:hypothetical protein
VQRRVAEALEHRVAGTRVHVHGAATGRGEASVGMERVAAERARDQKVFEIEELDAQRIEQQFVVGGNQ